MATPKVLHCHPNGKNWWVRKGNELRILVGTGRLRYPYHRANVIASSLKSSGYEGKRLEEYRKELESCEVCFGCDEVTPQ
ncbi:hypothetical protein [Shimazuella alba]|jgi:hypothetical protein|uniref:Uncharacterized protein n=1 Tax=Shimazuella alba TaxID=2690964 RepID=A0A6I4VUK4_9BACL|nr:hypothetical protein [Shimazuella alba]MXQ55257.1 hypothetical protein [Shimazuella alba]